MKKYGGTILHKCSDLNGMSKLLSVAIEVLGFEPKYMDIYFDEFSKPLNDIVFDEEYLNLLILKQPTTVIIKNNMFEGDNSDIYFSFSLNIRTDEKFRLKTCSLSWLNKSLDFLLNSNQFKLLLESDELVYCYCYDQHDSYDQSKISRRNPNFDNSSSSNGNANEFILNDVNVSEQWGRALTVRGMTFMAAPLMWFGKEFYEIIPYQKLLGFKYASEIILTNHANVYIELFNLYDEPSKGENRAKQKEFWFFFDLQTVIKNYETNNSIDAVAWLKSRAALKKGKKGK